MTATRQVTGVALNVEQKEEEWHTWSARVHYLLPLLFIAHHRHHSTTPHPLLSIGIIHFLLLCQRLCVLSLPSATSSSSSRFYCCFTFWFSVFERIIIDPAKWLPALQLMFLPPCPSCTYKDAVEWWGIVISEKEWIKWLKGVCMWGAYIHFLICKAWHLYSRIVQTAAADPPKERYWYLCKDCASEKKSKWATKLRKRRKRNGNKVKERQTNGVCHLYCVLQVNEMKRAKYRTRIESNFLRRKMQEKI